MSHDNEELVDFDDIDDVVANGKAPSSTNGAASAQGASAEGDKSKKNFSGIHSTGFRSARIRVFCECLLNITFLETSC